MTTIWSIKEEDTILFKGEEEVEQDIGINIFRYKFTKETTDAINHFAKLHEYDTRDEFKEAWLKWVDSHMALIEQETRFLYSLGYEGNVVQKMFKSARYYFRHKTIAEKRQSASRKGTFITCPKIILNAMESHIRDGILRGNLKPSHGFEAFIETNAGWIEEEMRRFARLCDLEQKLKKTYKNRYFRITKDTRDNK